ncbi:MAG: hypothetical protein J5I98_17880 [Phaeodactylibacter sp.]|nr:hypothetical protein [Phaeodactylibacter sp.]
MPPPKPKAANKEQAPPAPFRWRRNLLAGLGLAAVLFLGIWGVKQLLGSPPAENETRGQLELFSSNGKYGYRDQSGKAIIAATYDSAGLFQDGRAEVALDGQTFTIDSTGACVAGCPEDKDKAAWAEAEDLNNIDAYKRYQQEFPKGQFYGEAGKRIKAFEAQLLRDEAARQDQQAWEAARKKDDMAAYENYQKSYPIGQYYQEAQKRIDVLKSQERQAEAARKEERAWQDAKSKNTISAYKSYQAAYPGGKYYSEAGKKIREMEDAAKQPDIPGVRLNGLTWTAQNLDIDVPDSWCYEGKAANCRKYGRLYTWQAAKKACAALGGGWRLPTDEEWSALRDKYGGSEGAYKALIESGNSGFSALLGGWRNTDGRFYYLGDYGNYWSATESGGSSAWRYRFSRYYGELNRLDRNKGFGFSCRCVQAAPSNGID